MLIISQFSPHNSIRQHPIISLKDEMTKSIRFRLSFSQSYLYNILQLMHFQGRISSRLIPRFSFLHSGPSSLVSAMTQQRAREGLLKEQAGPPPPGVLGGGHPYSAPGHPHLSHLPPFTVRKPDAAPQAAVFCRYRLRKNTPKDVLGFFNTDVGNQNGFNIFYIFTWRFKSP